MRTLPVTISVAFVHGILAAVRAAGGQTGPLLRKAGISPALLAEPDARVTADQYVALFCEIMTRLNDEALGFFSRPLRRGTLTLIMRSALGARSVESAAKRLCASFELVQDDVRFALVRDGALCGPRLAVPNAYLPERVFIHELLLRILSRFVVWLHDGRLRPVGFDFAYPAPPHAGEYPRLFSGDVCFDQPASVAWFSHESLQAPVRRDEAALRQFILHSPRNVIVPLRHDGATSDRIRAHLQTLRPHWPDLPAAAQFLHMSVSTLQQRLANEGTSFQAIKDQLRRDWAIARLNTSAVSLAGLAAELGYSDQAVFQRAFKSWTGSAPGAYRQQVQHED